MEYIVEATERQEHGRGAARSLRRAGRVPGVLYGGKKTVQLSLEARHLMSLLQDEAFRSSVVKVRLEGKSRTTQALLREVQWHPVRRDIIHVDFQEVRADREISAQVPLHFINTDTAPGVKLQHGVFTAVENQVAVHCLPQHLPEYIEVDAGTLEMGKSIHLSEIAQLEGVRFDEIVRGNDPALAAIASIAAEVEPEPVSEEVEESESSDATTATTPAAKSS